MTDFDYYNTLLVQSVGSKEGSTAPTITPSASYGYKNAKQAQDIFSGTQNLPLYARVGNPTNAKLESIVTKIENGFGSIATSSGMGALSMVLTAFLSSGDEILCIGGFFGGTYTLVNETMKRFGIKNSFCDINDFEHIESKLKFGIKMILMESVGNPSLRLPDIQKISSLCQSYETLLVVDNTATPLLVRPLDLGADIVVHSSTKNMSGHSAALGGITVFRKVDNIIDKLSNQKYADIHKFVQEMGEKAFIGICKKRSMRDIGMSANAFGSFLTLLGLETLALRVQRVNNNLSTIVKILDHKLTNDVSVKHPSLSKDEDHNQYKTNFSQGCGPVFTINCQSAERAFSFLDKLNLITQTANIGDNRTLALHMASTIYSDFDEATKEFLGVHDGLIRVSVGLEDPKTIAEDFLQAANSL